jgi:hypothetical protein
VEESIPSDPGFVVEWQLADVEWQLADDADSVIDLSMAEAQVRRSDLATMAQSNRVPTPR